MSDKINNDVKNDNRGIIFSDTLASLLREIITQIESLGGDFDREKHALDDLEARLTHGYYHLAVLGQFKRGKSTFLNALIGKDILPSSVIPLTTIPTFIRYGSSISICVYFDENQKNKSFAVNDFKEAKNLLSQFVTEKKNPRNKLGVLKVELFYPADILSKGVIFIDTPGIGSTFRHNTEATLNFLPQCDAAIFLVSSDPPITEVEVDFLKEVKQKVSRLFFVLNKADYLDEKERQTALNFFQSVLKEQAGFNSGVDIFCVSAKQGLKAAINRDSSLCEISGIEKIRTHLINFNIHEKITALTEAVSQKVYDILENIIMRFHLLSRSLKMPLKDLEDRLNRFTEKVDEIEQEKTAAKDILNGDQKRMHELLEKKASAITGQARKYLNNIIMETVYRDNNNNLLENKLKNVMASAIPRYFEHEFGKMMNLFNQERNRIFKKHQSRVEFLVDSIRKTAAELFEIPYTPGRDDTALKITRPPHWITHKWRSLLFPVSLTVIDKFLSPKKRQQRILDRIMEQVKQLIITNVENLRWSLFQAIDRDFISFRSKLDKEFEETVNALHGATRAVMKKRKAQTLKISEESASLEENTKKIENLLGKIIQ